MAEQYLDVAQHRGRILCRKLVNNKEQRTSGYYTPPLYTATNGETEFKSFFGKPVAEKTFKTTSEYREYKSMYGSIEGEVFGHTDFKTHYIYDNFKNQEFDIAKVNVAYIDIEVLTKIEVNGELVETGFPKASEALRPINAITQYNTNDKKYVCFATAEWIKEKSILSYADDVVYIPCKDEEQLLTKWLQYWTHDYPVIMTGWNCVFFDMTYIVNRLYQVLGGNAVNKLSPWGIVEKKTGKNTFGQEEDYYEILGVNIIDYKDAYKKYRYKPREKYTLDFICKSELDEGSYKLHYTGTLSNLYFDNPIYFCDYNINDVHCVLELDKKLQFMPLIISLCYYSGINFADNFSPIKIWETMIFRECYANNIIVPLTGGSKTRVDYEGAYVHPPKPGLKHKIASFDYTSLYPSLMRQFSISREVFVSDKKYSEIYNNVISLVNQHDDVELIKAVEKRNLVDYYVERDIPDYLTEYLQQENVSMSMNVQFFDVSKDALFSVLVNRLFKERKEDKNKSQEYSQLAKNAKEELKRRNQ